MFEVDQILQASTGAFVFFQLLQADDVNRELSRFNQDPLGIAVVEGDPRDRCLNFNPHRWNAHTDDLIILQEELCRQFRDIEAERV